VEMRHRFEHDEELRIGRIRMRRSRHADDAALEGDVREFRRQDGQLRSPGPGQPLAELLQRAELDLTGLRHEALDHPMEHHAVIGAVRGEGAQPLGMGRGAILEEIDRDLPLPRHLEDEIRLLRHPRAAKGNERCRQGNSPHCARSAATRTEFITPGRAGGSPRGMASTCSMPEITRPQTVYWPFRKCPSLNMMKNCELPELGLCARAMPTTPRSKGSFENSAGRSGRSEPPAPARPRPLPAFPCFTSPVWALNPSMTRWKTTPSYSPARASALICSTCFGATSGSISTTTSPVPAPVSTSITSVFSGSFHSAMPSSSRSARRGAYALVRTSESPNWVRHAPSEPSAKLLKEVERRRRDRYVSRTEMPPSAIIGLPVTKL